MEKSKQNYGPIWIANLCSQTKGGEDTLNKAYEEILLKTGLNATYVNYKYFDFHAITKGTNFSAINRYIEQYEPVIEECGFNEFIVSKPEEHSANKRNCPVVKQLSKQNGIIRTNCVDCLDRTNAFQTKIGFIALRCILRRLGIQKLFSNSP